MDAPETPSGTESLGVGGSPAPEGAPASAEPTPPAEGSAPPTGGVISSAPFLPETYHGDPAFEGFDSLDGVLSEFKTLRALQKTREDQGLVSIPGEGATPEEQAAFFNKLGRPETPAEYSIEVPEGFPEALEISDERTAKFAQRAHDLGLTQAQVSGIYDLHNEFVMEEYSKLSQNDDQALEANLQVLEKMWGKADSPEFKAKHAQAEKAFNFVADPDLTRMFQQNRLLATHPSVMEVLSRIGGHLTEDQVPSVAGTTSRADFSAETTLSGIEAKINAFPFNEMMDKLHTREGKAQYEEWKALNAQRRELINQKMGLL